MRVQNHMTDYAAMRRGFEWEVPEHYNFARDVIDVLARDAEKPAMIWVDDAGAERRLTFADFSRRSRRLCNVLAAAGLKRGDVVMVVLPRQVEWWETLTACIRMGLLVAPGTTQLTTKDMQYRAGISEAACIVTTGELTGIFDTVAADCPSVKLKIITEAPREGWVFYTDAVDAAPDRFDTVNTRSDDDCMVYFTSGTVGMPKMVLHTHASYPIVHQVTKISGSISKPGTFIGTSATPGEQKRPGAAISAPGAAVAPCLFTIRIASIPKRPSIFWRNTPSPPYAAPPPSIGCWCSRT